MDLINQLLNLAALPMHALLVVMVFVLYRDGRRREQQFIEYLMARAEQGDPAAQQAMIRIRNGDRSTMSPN